MNFTRFRKSLVTRLVLFGITAVVVSTLARYIILLNVMQEEQRTVMTQQQIIIANHLAIDINHQLMERRRYLERLAAQLPVSLLKNPPQLQLWLRERQNLYPIFSTGLFVSDDKDRIIADSPQLKGRTGMDVSIYPGLRRVRAGMVLIADPMISPVSGQPFIPILAPVHDNNGKIVAVIGGGTMINNDGFIDRIPLSEISGDSEVDVVAPGKKLIVSSSNPERNFQPLPKRGIDPVLDQAVDGFLSNGTARNAEGKEEIRSMASIASTNWFVLVTQPASTDTQTLSKVREVILHGTLVQAAVIFAFILTSVICFFRPLQRTADQADKMTRGELPLAPLPVVQDDEIGHLTLAFNRLLARLKRHQAELQYQAHHDQLTGLPNRVMLAQRMQLVLSDARRDRSGIALLFLDLDGFKLINDTHGHQVGDLVLQQISQRLLNVARKSDTLARVGGDEFVLLITDLGIAMPVGARVLAEKCINTVAQPILINHIECQLGVSIGIALTDGSCGPEQLLQAADHAMYDAKSKGRNGYTIAPALVSQYKMQDQDPQSE
ncbi:diguanylate cyclase (GGDEF)-like protein [Herbaspirillum sp. Sphag1AN]|uniref:diguanylate cyclase domain-containing protein n=1 Tax=unclassified Herbaspirillum TaxID=2624150 RepID=UPI0016152A4B|nr:MULTISPECIES: diguanylate cyclase [unclassified Herbaspirillum]MBB3210792.1 diguanylate cyclase (GGDEF)-like protein [Herbaspirillum sp. Sphag1AN]MBB3244422.1 diguanylate cyclase (GGDEF)-like protein [Herbaspirillum sp. Sphag64]